MGKLLAICTSPKRGTVKTEVPSAVLTPEWGIVEDAHGGNWHRQVSMLSAEKIEAFRKKIWVDYGAFGENLVIEGFDFRNLPVTSRFAIGDVVLEMTQIGKECHNDCVIKQQTGECIMPHEGVFARVLTGGEIHVGDEVTLLPALENPPLRAAVITLSDKGSRGEREDKSGPLIAQMLTAAGYVVEETMILPDEAKALKAQLIRMADGRQVNLVLTTGGTGFSPRDITPEATCRPQRPRHCRSYALSQPEHHPARDAEPRRQRVARQDPDRQPAGQPQGGAGEPRVHPAQLGARGTHRRGSGRRVRPQVRVPALLSLTGRRNILFFHLK